MKTVGSYVARYCKIRPQISRSPSLPQTLTVIVAVIVIIITLCLDSWWVLWSFGNRLWHIISGHCIAKARQEERKVMWEFLFCPPAMIDFFKNLCQLKRYDCKEFKLGHFVFLMQSKIVILSLHGKPVCKPISLLWSVKLRCNLVSPQITNFIIYELFIITTHSSGMVMVASISVYVWHCIFLCLRVDYTHNRDLESSFMVCR